MEICDNCGSMIPRERSIGGCGNVDDGYYCSERCQEELFNKNYYEDDQIFLLFISDKIKIERYIYYLLLCFTMKNNLIKPITLEIEKDLWEKFKGIVTRDKTLNEALIELIEKEVKK